MPDISISILAASLASNLFVDFFGSRDSSSGQLAEEWLDHRYPQLRFVEPAAQAMPPSVQLRAAIDAVPSVARPRSDATHGHGPHEHEQATDAEPSGGPPVQEMILPGDFRHSTTVLFLDERGLPFPVFVDPHDARVLGVLASS